MIRINGAEKRFGSCAALDGATAWVPEGRVYGLVGPNGSGKSTLLRLIAGVYRPDRGEVLVDGKPVFQDMGAKGKVFFLPDDPWLLPGADLNGMARLYRDVYPAFDQGEYERLCAAFPIDPGKPLAKLSKGLRRQGELILALSCRTPCLLLDEAFDGLDPVIRLAMKKALIREVEGRRLTVVIASHNLRELEDLCDRVGILYRGRVRLERELDELKLGFCKVQAAFSGPVDWEGSSLDLLRQERQGNVVSLLIRGGPEETLEALGRYQPLFAQAVPLTLEEAFIGEMEALGYDCGELLQ